MESREQINAVWQMQNYIEGHLDEPITLHALAKSAGYSPWHCARIFKELTGKAPFEYIRMYRLSKAAMELRDNDIKVVDVAMDFLFDSHEGFTRAFRRQFGMSPNEYKKNTPPIYLFIPGPYGNIIIGSGICRRMHRRFPGTFLYRCAISPKESCC